MWFDDDDIMHPELLKKQLKSIQEHHASISVCKAYTFKDSLEFPEVKPGLLISENPFDDFVALQIIVPICCGLFERSLLEKAPYLYDTELQAAQEWEFFSRLFYISSSYAVVEDPLVYIRQHQHNISNRNEKLIRWNYFLARFKMYTNSRITLNLDTQNYLHVFMMKEFKKMVRNRYTKIALKAYWLFVLPKSKISLFSKINAFIAILSFSLFRKGTYFFRNIEF